MNLSAPAGSHRTLVATIGRKLATARPSQLFHFFLGLLPYAARGRTNGLSDGRVPSRFRSLTVDLRHRGHSKVAAVSTTQRVVGIDQAALLVAFFAVFLQATGEPGP